MQENKPITRQDLITDEALNYPKEYAERYREAGKEADLLLLRLEKITNAFEKLGETLNKIKNNK